MDVLACLHQRGPATARELRERLNGYRPMSHGAIVTLLSRLQNKGLVVRKKGPVGKAFVFTAKHSASRTFRGFMKQVVRRVFHGDTVALVASLFETQRPTRAEVDKLQELLDELRQENGRKQ